MKKIKNSIHYHNIFKFEELKAALTAKEVQMNFNSIAKKTNIVQALKKNSISKKKTAIIKITSLLMTIINLTIKIIKTVSRISIQQFFMTEIMKNLIDSQIINLITSVLLLILTNNQVRILKSL